MTAVLESLVPVFLVILVGWLITSRGWVKDAQWAGLSWLGYRVLYPALIIDALARASLAGGVVLAMITVMVAGVLIVAALTYAAKPLLDRAGYDGPAFTSVLQGTIRWQTFVAFAIAASLLGPVGTAYLSVAVAVMIPLVNILCVGALLRHGQGGGEREGMLVELAKNPFMVACAIGIAVNLLGIPLPKVLFGAMDILGKAGLAAALILTGAALKLADAAKLDLAILLTVALKLVAMPLIALIGGRWLGLDGVALNALVIAMAVPTAGAATILARQMGGDVPLMARIATAQTLAALVTMPVFLVLAAG